MTKTTSDFQAGAAFRAFGCVLFLGISQDAGAAVTFLSREASSDDQTISADVLDFFVNSSSVIVEKDGGPADWSFSGGAVFDGNSNQSASWTVGTPEASGTSSTATYLPFGPSFGENQVATGSVSFTASENLPTVVLTLYAIPNGNTESITYDYSLLVNGISQHSEAGVSEAGVAGANLDLEIFKFEISGLNSGDTLAFQVDNVSGSNGWHNFAFLGGSIAAVPEPSALLFSCVALMALLAGSHRRPQA